MKKNLSKCQINVLSSKIMISWYMKNQYQINIIFPLLKPLHLTTSIRYGINTFIPDKIPIPWKYEKHMSILYLFNNVIGWTVVLELKTFSLTMCHCGQVKTNINGNDQLIIPDMTSSGRHVIWFYPSLGHCNVATFQSLQSLQRCSQWYEFDYSKELNEKRSYSVKQHFSLGRSQTNFFENCLLCCPLGIIFIITPPTVHHVH